MSHRQGYYNGNYSGNYNGGTRTAHTSVPTGPNGPNGPNGPTDGGARYNPSYINQRAMNRISDITMLEFDNGGGAKGNNGNNGINGINSNNGNNGNYDPRRQQSESPFDEDEVQDSPDERYNNENYYGQNGQIGQTRGYDNYDGGKEVNQRNQSHQSHQNPAGDAGHLEHGEDGGDGRYGEDGEDGGDGSPGEEGEDAVLDLAELEQLQEEAERMKGLGNKHMAAQEYTRAYNAYSAALQLSPVGPSSHVFLSNRAASLLSLKRYSAAAVDARRAVALAPEFGKAHARLGQALYFLKEYGGAVVAYEDALRFEEEAARREGNGGNGGNGGNSGNMAVTRAYLEKAREKLARQEEKERRKQMAAGAGGAAGSVGGAGTNVDSSADAPDTISSAGEESVNPTIAYSVATDKDRVGLASGQHTNSQRIETLTKSKTVPGESGVTGVPPEGNEGDLPSLRLQRETNQSMESVASKESKGSRGAAAAANQSQETMESAHSAQSAQSAQSANSPMGSPFQSFHGPTSHSSPTLMTVETGPMGGPAQRRVEPQDRGVAGAAGVAANIASLDLNQDTSIPGSDTSNQPQTTQTNTPTSLPATPSNETNGSNEPDPDFDEALHLQRRATHYLSHKQYRRAVDDFSAALFLVPDDPVLTPQLHVGRAHALNGLERFGSAKNDALMALRQILRGGGGGAHGTHGTSGGGNNGTGSASGGGDDNGNGASLAEAYSVLGKALYYAKDYQGAMEAFEECSAVWTQLGGKLSVFDEAYLEQCREALDAGLGVSVDEESSVRSGRSGKSSGVVSVVSAVKEGRSVSNIPKLKPPRFVSREQALQTSPSLPPMPKSWPLQSPTSPSSISHGPERTVTFLSDAMGIKLNRGTDGLVRVISVAHLPPGSPILRKGTIEAGDLVREAGGVDLRRPITATMWGDTVALIKMARRPIEMVVARELTGELGELERDKDNGSGGRRGKFEFSSAVGGEEPVVGRDGGDGRDWEDVLRDMGIEFPSPSSGEEAIGIPSNGGACSDPETRNDAGGNATSEPQSAESDNNESLESAKEEAGEVMEQAASGEGESSAPEVVDDTRDSLDPSDKQNTHVEGIEQVKEQPDTEEQADEKVSEHESPSAPPPATVGNDKGESTHDTNGTNNTEPPTENKPQEPNDSSNLEIQPSASSVSSVGESPTKPKQSKQSNEPPSLDREILFDDSVIHVQPLDDGTERDRKKVQGLTNQRWNAKSDRALVFAGQVMRGLQGRFFFSADCYEPRTLAIYQNPDLILILRAPKNVDEIRRLLPIQNGLEAEMYEAMTSLLESFFVAESVIDPNTCKLRLSQLTTLTSVPSKELAQSQGRRRSSTSRRNDFRKQSCFDIVTPTEAVSLSAIVPLEEDVVEVVFTSPEAIEKTRRVETAISEALFRAHSKHDHEASHNSAWKHQVVLGTLHSYVLSGNDQTLKEAIMSALLLQKSKSIDYEDQEQKIESSIIDARDDSGKTALHYACSRRSNATVNLLIKAGANSWIPTQSDAKTPCHISAECLDEKSLSILLASTHPARPDPNALDCLGRTPMYLAAVEGRGVDGKSDAITMGRCLSALDAWGGLLIFNGGNYLESKKLLHPIHCVSAQWKSAELSVILSHCNYHYPLLNDDGSDSFGVSLSGVFHYPIHAALISLRKEIFLAFEKSGASAFDVDFMSSDPALVKTIRILLEHGFEPNERFEGIPGQGAEIEALSNFFGFTPLQILVTAAKEAKAIDIQKQEAGDDDFDTMRILRNVMEVVQATAELLLKNGARTNLPPPPPTRLDRETPPGCYSLKDALASRNLSSLPELDRVGVKIEGDDDVMTLLGGIDNVRKSQTSFSMMVKSISSTGALKILKGVSSALDSNTPGGSDSNSCAICWSEFGMISNRKQFCHVSCRYVCNDCSTKRLVDDGTEYRISDGQFLLGKVESEKSSSSIRTKEDESRSRILKGAQRRSLARRKSSKSGFSSDSSTASNAISSLNQTRDAVVERGNKLENLADKSAALESASLDFANMAKELSRQQQSSFW